MKQARWQPKRKLRFCGRAGVTGERIPRSKPSRIEPLNRALNVGQASCLPSERSSASQTGGCATAGRQDACPTLRFMERRCLTDFYRSSFGNGLSSGATLHSRLAVMCLSSQPQGWSSPRSGCAVPTLVASCPELGCNDPPELSERARSGSEPAPSRSEWAASMSERVGSRSECAAPPSEPSRSDLS